MNFLRVLFKGSDKLTVKQEKYRQIFMYLFCGGVTTIVNIVAFAIFDLLVDKTIDVSIIGWNFDLLLLLNQTISWVLAVIVAFITNRLFVFLSDGSIVKEFMLFVASRIATFFIFELGTFALFIMLCENVFKYPQDDVALSIFGFDVTYLYVVKIVNSVILVIANYFLSKVFIFKRKNENSGEKV